MDITFRCKQCGHNIVFNDGVTEVPNQCPKCKQYLSRKIRQGMLNAMHNAAQVALAKIPPAEPTPVVPDETWWRQEEISLRQIAVLLFFARPLAGLNKGQAADAIDAIYAVPGNKERWESAKLNDLNQFKGTQLYDYICREAGEDWEDFEGETLDSALWRIEDFTAKWTDELEELEQAIHSDDTDECKRGEPKEPRIHVAGNFSAAHTEADMIRQLETKVWRKLTFAGASELQVQVVKNSLGEFELLIRGPDELVEMARKRLRLPKSASGAASEPSSYLQKKVRYLP